MAKVVLTIRYSVDLSDYPHLDTPEEAIQEHLDNLIRTGKTLEALVAEGNAELKLVN